MRNVLQTIQQEYQNIPYEVVVVVVVAVEAQLVLLLSYPPELVTATAQFPLTGDNAPLLNREHKLIR